MLHFLRSFMTSKVGVIITLAALAVIAFAFAVADVANTGTFGGVAGGDRVAIVGDAKISTSELSSAVSSDLEQYRRENPTATMESYIASGGMERTLSQMLDRIAIAEFGRQYGLRAGHRLVDSELIQIPAFHGPDGRFNESAYRTALAQQGISEELLRADVAAGLLARQVLVPVSLGASIPRPLITRYTALLRERREGVIGFLPSDAYAPNDGPSDAQLQAYYTAQRDDYLRPERRVIRYTTFDESALGNLRAPTDAEIAARYNRDSAEYAASERRRMTQLVVPTEAAAKAIITEVASGQSLAAAAQGKGLAVTQIGPLSQAELAEQSSAAVAQAAFAAEQGAIAAPARGALGFYVLRIDAVERTPARSLAQVREEISAKLAAEQRRAALADMSSELEDEISRGSSLSDVAAKLGLSVSSAAEVLASGQIYGKPGETVPEVIRPVVSTAFDMREGEPQLVEATPGRSFLIFEVSDITPSTAPPLAEIRDSVAAAWKRSEGASRAKEAADRVMKRVRSGRTVAEAMAEESVSLPPPDAVNMDRMQLGQTERIPSVLVLMFSMAKGTSKRLEAPNNNGWFVVKLNDIKAPDVAGDDPMIEGISRELGEAAENELAAQLVAAIKDKVGVERNQSAINAVEAQLTGRNQR